MTWITVEHNPSPMKLDVLNVEGWPVWSKEVSTFEWTYDSTEICYILEGEAIVTPQGENRSRFVRTETPGGPSDFSGDDKRHTS